MNQQNLTPTTPPLLILVDGHSLAFNAYYAFAKSRKGPLMTSTGIPTSVCFGFINSLLPIIKSQQPQYLAIAFDLDTPTFRHESDPNYKATRKETPEDFIPDLKNLQQLLTALNLKIVTVAGYEADDVIANLARQGSAGGYQVKILSGDRDLFQLVDDQQQISILYINQKAIKSSNSLYTEINRQAVQEKLGITPEQVADYKALCGDASDNIPGVKGIGEKTAFKLLLEYNTLEGIYQNLDKIKGAVKTKLATGKDDAKHSQFLAQLAADAPTELKIEDCKLQGFEVNQVIPWLEKLELKSFIKDINQLQNLLGGSVFETKQLSLFDEPKSPITPQIINTPEKLTELINLLKTYTNPTKPVAWDTETTSLNPREAKLVGIGCCWGNEPTSVAYIPINHTQGNNLDKELVLSSLSPILTGEEYPKVLQNTKYDRVILWHHGIKLAGVVFDTMLASYVLHPERSHNLKDLSQRYLNLPSQSYKELGIPKDKTIADLDIKTVAEYCGMDAYGTFKLVAPLRGELEKIPALNKLLLEVEQPLEVVLAEMEDKGICLDTAYLQELSQQLAVTLAELEKQTYADAGEVFNLDSPQQLSEILFEKLGLDRRKSRKIKTGYSTDHGTLEKLEGEHPVIEKILEYRTLAKLKSTYVDALPALVSPETQRLHTDFNQTVTGTGRLSSSNPNLQNIPIRTEFSRKIRQAFIPQKGWLLVSADYSQIELRILTHLSGEEVLQEAYRNGDDVHSVTAKLLFEKETITPAERRLGKIINFGVIYGMGAQRFAREAGVSVAEGKEFIEKYRQRYGRVFAYLEKTKKQAIASGYVTTILGRRRYFDFTSDTFRKLQGTPPDKINLEQIKYNYADSQLLRAAANAPIQGSSADIIKIAMVQLHKILPNYQAALLLQVHDELVFEIPPDEWEELEPQIKQTMENAVELTVPLVVDVHGAENWLEAK
ncbi:MAG: DNA polymerase I [Gomphosphaeria aponina SAG 52.96 = DSM 107014]|uniref:DNA polymerase I n=1 Tax=Gomphosphaeria aponina SAG 52.96 = DSM 107014 TaxID=1521640 RepID=A0A941GR22_9CHRO|nr:DNA polymerase I [Gomphosphaeria aponina SAG 52.96 = DSM 107014]